MTGTRTTPRPARRIAWRPVRPTGWWFDALLVAALVALTAILATGALTSVDVAVRDWCQAHWSSVGLFLAKVGNRLGQGGALVAVSLAIAGWFAWRRRTIRPLLPVLVAFALTYGLLKPFKDLTDRPAPHNIQVAHPELFGGGGDSYPSGHVANAIVWYGVLALLLAPWLSDRLRVALRVAPPTVLCVTTVYLGYHWFTDTVAGLLTGLILDRMMRRVPWDEPAPRQAHADEPAPRQARTDEPEART
ncbi:MAG TPA: phosphatase PAP2 family protein [Micromonosporaceae bacterium]